MDGGKLELDAPVSNYLPLIGRMKVARETIDPKTGEPLEQRGRKIE